jgi:hypothetical protein
VPDSHRSQQAPYLSGACLRVYTPHRGCGCPTHGSSSTAGRCWLDPDAHQHQPRKSHAAHSRPNPVQAHVSGATAAITLHSVLYISCRPSFHPSTQHPSCTAGLPGRQASLVSTQCMPAEGPFQAASWQLPGSSSGLVQQRVHLVDVQLGDLAAVGLRTGQLGLGLRGSRATPSAAGPVNSGQHVRRVMIRCSNWSTGGIPDPVGLPRHQAGIWAATKCREAHACMQARQAVKQPDSGRSARPC